MRNTNHQGMPWIRLPLSAQPPRRSEPLSDAERRRLQELLGECVRVGEQLPRLARRRDSLPEVTTEMIRDGWRKFFLSHFVFFLDFSLLAYCYEQATEALCARGEVPDDLIQRMSVLWRSAGALMVYGIDFEPTEEIYCAHIRPFMADGLSGTWLREYQLLTRTRKAWRSAVVEAADPLGALAALIARLTESEREYHRSHVQVMQACVPDMVSKLQDYESAHGPVLVSEEQLVIYDRWFHVARSEDLDITSYLETACSVFSDLIQDIETGTGLSEAHLTSLSQGLSVMLMLLSDLLVEVSLESEEETLASGEA